MVARILRNVGTLAPTVANSMVPFFSQCKAIKIQHSLVTWGQGEKIFPISPLTPSEPLGLISTFAPIGMLDLS
jgi:hypothetical protein